MHACGCQTASQPVTNKGMPTNRAAVTVGARVTSCRMWRWQCVRHCGHGVTPTHHTPAAAGRTGCSKAGSKQRPYCMYVCGLRRRRHSFHRTQSSTFTAYDDAVDANVGVRTAVTVTEKHNMAAKAKCWLRCRDVMLEAESCSPPLLVAPGCACPRLDDRGPHTQM